MIKGELNIKVKVSDANVANRYTKLLKGMMNLPEDKLLEFCELSENNKNFWNKVAKSLNNPLVRNHLK